MIFVVLLDGRLVAAPRRQLDENISHAVLSNGDPVLAAGEFSVGFHGSQTVIAALNDMSGHYKPGADGLAVAQEAFETAGFSVSPDAITSYDWESQ